MLKKIGLPVVLLAGLFAFAPRPAKAEVHFGVYLGAPAYPVYPAVPAYPAYGYDAYPDYYAYPPAPVYRYPAPAYVAPYSYGYRYDSRGYGRHEWRERDRHDRHERQEFRGRR